MDGTTTTDWVHTVMVYHGVGNGFTMYEDRTQIGADLDITTASFKTNGNRMVSIGKRFLSGGDKFCNCLCG